MAVPCEWLTFDDALRRYVRSARTQSQEHIKPMHWHVACRLVLEGGFDPREITPRPPFTVRASSKRLHLSYDETVAQGGERSVLGGLKTKQVDVTVCKEGIGPVMAVSMKGASGAFRNITNRMEEMIGDCTNLHMSYPALVYGFLQVIKANHEGDVDKSNDIAIRRDGTVVEAIQRYEEVLSRLTGRDDVRSESTKYESVALILVDPRAETQGRLIEGTPKLEGPLDVSTFFDRLYDQYDRRFIYAAPSLKNVTGRREWILDDALRNDPRMASITPRILDT